jgi:hypothetical protein
MENLTGESLLLYLSARLNSLDDDIQALMGEQERTLARKAFISEVKEWAHKLADANEALSRNETVDTGEPAPATEGASADGASADQTAGGNGETNQTASANESAEETNQTASADEGGGGEELPAGALEAAEALEEAMNAAAELVTGAETDVAPEIEDATETDGAERDAQEVVNELLRNFPEAPPGDLAFRQEIHQLFDGYCPGGNGASKENVERLVNRLDEINDELNGASELGMIRLQQLVAQRQLSVQLCTNMLSKCDEGLKGIVQNL